MKFTNMNEKKILVLIESLFITILHFYFSPVLAIVGRDLILTPRQGLQLSGKSIFYKEDSNEVLRNVTQHPWERTLKHVTFVTLFTDSAEKAVAGNISKLKEYTDFLKSPYIINENANFIRFGDIVMLANGRLEEAGNNTFRFIEGTCDFNCHPERVWALWQVQKIRHRDQYQNFRYEMKFSLSPLRTAAQSNDLYDKPKQDQASQHGDYYVKRNALKTYIQREDDYPHSFGRIIYPEETAFAQKRRNDQGTLGRNFRQVNEIGDTRQFTPLTPLPQSTFMHEVFQPYARLPPPPPIPPHIPPPQQQQQEQQQRLNIGEYMKMNMKGFLHPKATTKIELFPNQFNHMHRNSFVAGPTTFRPNYQVKLPRPEIYQHPSSADMIRFPVHRNEVIEIGNQLRPPLVTHHYHHHFFIPGSTEIGGNNSDENHINSNEQQETPIQQVTSKYYNNNNNNNHNDNTNSEHIDDYYETISTTPKQESSLLPAPHKITFPLTNIGEQIVEITPPSPPAPFPPFKAPQVYAIYPKSYAAKVPVLVYSASSTTATTSTHKPFINSETVTDTVRYSEPDPLYANDDLSNTQVESPYFNTATSTSNAKRAQPQPQQNDIEAQTPFPQKQYGINEIHRKTDQILNHSQKTLQFLPEDAMNLTINDAIIPTTESFEITTTTYETPTTTTTITSTTEATTPPSRVVISPPRHVTTPISTTKETGTTKFHSEFISTSTTEKPLRTVGRIRIGRSTTSTTASTVSKWKPKRRNQHRNFKHNLQRNKTFETNHKSSIRKEQLTTPSSSNNSFSSTSNSPQNVDKVLEVLTQKSVSKSVSIKVGNNGTEIPIISDDINENEVNKKE